MGIVISGSEDGEILDNVVSGAGIAAILLHGSNNSSAVNNSVMGCNIGIRLKDSTDDLVGQNRLDGNEADGILLEGRRITRSPETSSSRTAEV